MCKIIAIILPLIATILGISSHSKAHAQTNNNRVVIYDFWASWCESCVKNLKKLGQVFPEEAIQKLKIVSIDDSEADAKGALNSDELKSYQMLQEGMIWDAKGKLQRKFQVERVPTIVAVDGNGREVFRHEGLLTNRDIKKIVALTQRQEVSRTPSTSSSTQSKSSARPIQNKAIILDAIMDPSKTASAATALQMVPATLGELPLISNEGSANGQICPTCGS